MSIEATVESICEELELPPHRQGYVLYMLKRQDRNTRHACAAAALAANGGNDVHSAIVNCSEGLS